MHFVNKKLSREDAALHAEWTEIAGIHFDTGYNCAQSVMLVAASAYGLDINETMIRSMASFTGGIGNSGCTCGALMAAAMAAGMIVGDPEKKTNDKRADRAAADIMAKFKDSFGSSCCRALKNGLRGKTANKKCRELTTGAASILLEVACDQGFYPKISVIDDHDRQQKQVQ